MANISSWTSFFQTYRAWHFWLNTLDAVWQSLVIFFIPYLVFNGTSASMNELGIICMNALVFTALVHIALETKYFVRSLTVVRLVDETGSNVGHVSVSPVILSVPWCGFLD